MEAKRQRGQCPNGQRAVPRRFSGGKHSPVKRKEHSQPDDEEHYEGKKFRTECETLVNAKVVRVSKGICEVPQVDTKREGSQEFRLQESGSPYHEGYAHQGGDERHKAELECGHSEWKHTASRLRGFLCVSEQGSVASNDLEPSELTTAGAIILLFLIRKSQAEEAFPGALPQMACHSHGVASTRAFRT